MLLAFPLAAQWTPKDVMKAKTITEVGASPDGSRVTFTVTEQVMSDDKSELLRQVWIGNSDGSGAAPLTFGEKSSYDAKWMPDGNAIVFLSSRSGRAQLYLLRLRGGEAEPLTSGKLDIGGYEISSDGSSIAFAASEPNPDEEKRVKAKEDYFYVDEEPKPRHLYLIATGAKHEQRKLVTVDGVVGANQISWSPDGKWIAYATTKSSGTNDWSTSDVMLASVDTGETRAIANTLNAEADPHFSPDGKSIAYITSAPHWPQAYRIQLLRVDSGAAHQLAETYDAAPEILGFSRDGKRIVFSESRDFGNRVYAIDLASDRIAEISSGNEVFGEARMNGTGTHIALSMQSSDRPAEAWITAADHFAPTQVSHVNDELLKMPIPRTELIHWKSSDGNDVEGTLTYPLNYEAGKRVPLVLNVHGGPAASHHATFVGAYGAFPTAVYASKGYAVLRANPRGSTGYGRKFRFANLSNWGPGPFDDLMSGVDAVIKRGIADPDHMAVIGWSYGGFMTEWIVGHTKRFKVAVAGAGVSDLLSFTGTSDITNFLPDYFGGVPWPNLDVWRASSPITFVANMKTPLLLIHGDADERVPTTQSYELYHALKERGVPVRMLVIPRSHHNPTEPKMRLQVVTAAGEWVEKWIR
jgi:dipeptidyl aminopeptidase/acylaminoacyl peptidase